MTRLERVLADLDASTDEDLADVAALVAIESVSADPARAAAVRAAADWLAERASAAGLEVALHETPGFPFVTAACTGDPSASSVLVYAHYDVQPAEPLEAWTSPPFTATERGGRLYGRGASDDKGQLVMHLAVARSFLRVAGRLPINLTFVFEGEEEQASPHIDTFVAANVDRLRADVAVVTDGSMFAEGVPSVGYGVRGIVYLEVRVTALDHDLHSGIYGGAVPNAATILATLLASLHDPDGRVAVPGFYDRVEPLEAAERERIAALPFDEAAFAASAGVRLLGGEAGFSTLERLWVRPTLEVNGLRAGYTGEGLKTIVPATAVARISARLVPDQEPAEIGRLIEAHLRAVAPPSVEVAVELRSAGSPARVALDHPAVEAVGRALEAAYGRPAVYQRHGGTIPAVAAFSRLLRVPTLMIGFGLPEGNAHAPDEWLPIDSFRRGRFALARLWDDLGRGALGR